MDGFMPLKGDSKQNRNANRAVVFMVWSNWKIKNANRIFAKNSLIRIGLF